MSDSGGNCLKNWQKWLREREILQNYLGRCLDRQPSDLVMNLNEEWRMVNEEKTLIDYTEIQTEFDYYRGNPSFWKLPFELFNKNDPCGRSYLFGPESLKEKGIIPMLERVGVPTKILQEKHVYPRTRNMWCQWADFEYRKIKMKVLKEKLDKIQPHHPDYENLIVIGHKAEMCETKPSTAINQLSDSEEIKSDEQMKVSKVKMALKMEPQVSLIINGFHLKPNDLNTTKVFLLAFTDFNIQSKKLATKYLSIENKSSVPVKLSFRQIEPYNLFHDLIPYRQKGIVFFFGRGDLILTAGQKLEYPFKFKTSRPGNYDETWEIRTTPKLWKPPAKILLKLKGFADSSSAEKLKEISSDLDNNVRDSLVKDTIQELLYNVETRSEHIGILHYYDQAQLFETINSRITPYVNNPKYKFNTIVTENLKRLYDTVRQESDPVNWNYSIDELRLMVLQYDLNNEEGESKMEELNHLLNRLQAPVAPPCNSSQLYNVFSSFLCSSVIQICNDICRLQEDLGILFQPKYPVSFGSTIKLSSIEMAMDRKVSETKGSTKRRNSKGEESRKLRRDSKASSQRLFKRNSGSRRKKSIESSIEEISEESDAVTITKIPDYISIQYKHNLYVIFYTNLCKAIDAIESSVISKEEIVPHRSIKRLEECEFFEKRYHHKSAINLNALISEILHPEGETMEEIEQPSIPKLISYPEYLYQPSANTKPEMEKRSTSTIEGGKLDPNWLDFKEIGAQTSETSVEYDLVQKVEILQASTSLEDVEYNRDVACQKEEEEHVSDEEYFYPSEQED